MSVPFFQPTRREFLQAGLAAVALPALPTLPTAEEKAVSFWFVHSETGRCWPVDDPAAWALANADKPILARARERLTNTASCSDRRRVIRLVTRRCKLNLIEVSSQQVVVHYWGEWGQAWLQPFFHRHGLARRDVDVFLLNRKQETVSEERGDDYLFGEHLPDGFPLELYMRKWQRRDQSDSDDWTAIPRTCAGFGWEGLERNRIPWAALKSAWRRTAPGACVNCDRPTILTNFGAPWGMLGRRHRLDYVCRSCERLLKNYSVHDAGQWMLANLDAEVLPAYEMTGHYSSAPWPIASCQNG